MQTEQRAAKTLMMMLLRWEPEAAARLQTAQILNVYFHVKVFNNSKHIIDDIHVSSVHLSKSILGNRKSLSMSVCLLQFTPLDLNVSEESKADSNTVSPSPV